MYPLAICVRFFYTATSWFGGKKGLIFPGIDLNGINPGWNGSLILVMISILISQRLVLILHNPLERCHKFNVEAFRIFSNVVRVKIFPFPLLILCCINHRLR